MTVCMFPESNMYMNCDNCPHKNCKLRVIPAEDQHGREPDKMKPLAQYLGEYLTQDMFVYTKYDERHIGIRPDCLSRIVKEALDAYESTEQVKIRIEPV